MSCPNYTSWRERSKILKIDECYDYLFTPKACGHPKDPHHTLTCPWRGYGWKEVSECTSVNDYGLVIADEDNKKSSTALQST